MVMIRPVWSIVTPVARVALAGVWVYAALTKIGDPDAAVRAVRAYQVLPEWLVEPVAWGLPFLELALAALLVTGLAPRAAAWASLVVLGVFVAGIASVWARGLQIDCGCFGEGGPADVDGFDYFVDIARDVGFAVLALIAALGPDDPLQLRPRLPSRLRTWAGQAAVLALTVLAATAVGFVVQRERSELESRTVVQPESEDGPALVNGTPWTVGRTDAPVLVEIYEDFTCRTCRDVHDEIEPALTPFVEDGTVRIAYHAMPAGGDEAVGTAAAAACAHDAGAFLRYRDELFAAQDAGDPLTADRLIALGEAAGLTDARFANCVRDDRYEGWARERLDAGSRRGVVLTPTIFVDGELASRPLTPESLTDDVRKAARTPAIRTG